MDDIKALIVKNDLGLPETKTAKLIQLVNNRSVAQLSPDKESGPFLLYCTGTDFETIATRCSYPLDVVLLTAMHYRWNEKIDKLGLRSVENAPNAIQKDLANSLLVATYVAMQKQLGDVIAGRMKPEKCALIPKNAYALEKLMALVTDINNPTSKTPGEGGIAVNAQNVQINQGVVPMNDEDRAKKRKALLAELEKEKE